MWTDWLLSSHPLSTHKVCQWLSARCLQTWSAWPQQTPGASASQHLTCAHTRPLDHLWCRRGDSQQQTVCHHPPPPQMCRSSLWPHWSQGWGVHWCTKQCPSRHGQWWQSSRYRPQWDQSGQRRPRPRVHDTGWVGWTRAGHWQGQGQEVGASCSSALPWSWGKAYQLLDSSIEESFQNQNRGHQKAFSGDMKLLPEKVKVFRIYDVWFIKNFTLLLTGPTAQMTGCDPFV